MKPTQIPPKMYPKPNQNPPKIPPRNLAKTHLKCIQNLIKTQPNPNQIPTKTHLKFHPET